MKDGSGYIKLFRSIRRWRYWPGVSGDKFSHTEAWLDLVVSANHADRMVKDVLVRRGQLLTSLVRLAKLWGWDRKTVRKFLKDLVSGTEIGTAKTNRYTMITICNYNTYQANAVGAGAKGGQRLPQQAPQQTPQQGGHEQELGRHLEGIEKGKLTAELQVDNNVMEAYNRICVSFPKIRKIDGARSDLIGCASSDIDDWEEFFTTVEASGNWLKSKNFADFEWLLDNRLRIMEGKYLDKKQRQMDRSNDSVPR